MATADKLGMTRLNSYEILYAAEELTSGYSHRRMVSGTSFMAEARPQLQRGLDAMATARQVWREAFLIDDDELQAAWKEVVAGREYLDSYVIARNVCLMRPQTMVSRRAW